MATRIEASLSDISIRTGMEGKPLDDSPPLSNRPFSLRDFVRGVGDRIADIIHYPSLSEPRAIKPDRKGPTLTRRNLLRAGVALGATTVLGSTSHMEPAFAENLSDGNSIQVDQLMSQTGEKYGIDGVGVVLSKAFKWRDGTWLKVYQGGVIQYIPDSGEINLWNTLDVLSDDLKLDAKLNDGSLRVTVPPKENFDDHSGGNFVVAFNTRNKYFNPHPDVQKWVNEKRQTFETGALTSHEVDYEDYTVTRYQRVAVQRWTKGPKKGLVQRILVGEAMKNAGLIPEEALLKESGQVVTLTAASIDSQTSLPSSGELLNQGDYLKQMRDYIESSGRKGWVEQFKGRMLEIAQNLKKGPGRIIPSEKYPQYTFARDGFWALMTLQDKGFTQQVVDRFRADQANNKDGRYATALLYDDDKPDKRDRDEESTMMLVLEQLLLRKLGGNIDVNSLSRAYSFIKQHVSNGEYVTNGDPHPEEAGSYHYWADTFSNPPGSVIAYNQGLFCTTLRALKEMGIAVDNSLINQAEDRYRNLANPQNAAILPQRKGSSTIDTSSMVGEALSLYFFDRSILGRDKVLATYNHIVNNPTKVTRSNGRFVGFKVLSDFQGGYLSQSEFRDLQGIDTPGSYQNGGSWALYDELLLYSAIRHGAGNQAKELLLQRLESEGIASHEFIYTGSQHLGTADKDRDDYGWNTAVVRILP